MAQQISLFFLLKGFCDLVLVPGFIYVIGHTGSGNSSWKNSIEVNFWIIYELQGLFLQ